MPNAQTFCPYALSAEAFAGAAFGENILGLFRLSGQTILIVEYNISWGDTLAGQPLAKIAYGYGVVPILQQTRDSKGQLCDVLLPTDEQYLKAGDRPLFTFFYQWTAPHRTWRDDAASSLAAIGRCPR